MTKRTDIKRIMVIGSGPIVIGQAAEFDYAGTQACLALREEGYEVILVNSNTAPRHPRPARRGLDPGVGISHIISHRHIAERDIHGFSFLLPELLPALVRNLAALRAGQDQCPTARTATPAGASGVTRGPLLLRRH